MLHVYTIIENLGRLWLAYTELQVNFTCKRIMGTHCLKVPIILWVTVRFQDVTPQLAYILFLENTKGHTNW